MKDLEVRHCRVLLALHDTGGVGAAARALGLSQSTVSETLLALERLLGGPVTLRRPGRVATLTPVAETLVPHARAMVAASEAALAAVTREGRGAIRLGAVESLSSFLLPAPLRAFRRLWPQVEVAISTGLCVDLRARVERGELDGALTVESLDRPGDACAVHELSRTELELVVSPGHPLDKARVTRADLEGRDFLLTDSEGAFCDLLKGWAARAGWPPRLASAGSIDGVKRAVADGDVIGVLPRYALTEELAARSLATLRLETPLPEVSVLLTTLKPLDAPSPLAGLMGQIGLTLGAGAPFARAG